MRRYAIPLTLLCALSAAACGGFFQDDNDDRNRRDHDRRHDERSECDEDDDRNDNDGDDDPLGVRPRDGGVAASPDASAVTPAPDAGGEPVLADAGVTPPIDAGTSAPDAGPTCAPGECACVRDDDCPIELVCDHAAGVCVTPPVRCRDRASEADCVAEATCQPVYAGMNCRNANGGECASGDVDCTCESFSYAACADR